MLIEPEMLATLLQDPNLILLDTRFNLANVRQGRMMHQQGHIPGALYADLEKDLSGAIILGKTGRHPLPEPIQWQSTLRNWGVNNHSTVVVYDDGGHAMAARAWWLLRWAGVTKVRILHGGMKAWQAARYPITAKTSNPSPSLSAFATGQMPTISSAELLAALEKPLTLIDARAYERFRGEEEAIDCAAGHIPGAVCHPFTNNLDENGRFLTPERLHDMLTALIGNNNKPIFYCGSGVTACHNIFAMELAGLSGAVLYPGSWSEWITDLRRPVEPSHHLK